MIRTSVIKELSVEQLELYISRIVTQLRKKESNDNAKKIAWENNVFCMVS